MTEALVRAATVEDARAIAEVHVASWRAAYSDIVGPEKMAELDVEERTAAWRERIPLVGAEGFRTWVAEREGRVVGYSFTRPTEDDDLDPLEVAEVVALYLHPDHFGSGVGAPLLARAIAGIRSQGFLQATLWVLEDNARAIHFYRREGWRPDGKREACYRVMGAPAIRMRYPL